MDRIQEQQVVVDEPTPLSIEQMELLELRELVRQQEQEIDSLCRHIGDMQDWHSEDLAAVRAQQARREAIKAKFGEHLS